MTLKIPDIPQLRFLTRFWGVQQDGPEDFSLIDLGRDTIKVAVVRIQAGRIQVLGHSLVSAEEKEITYSRADAAVVASLVNRALQEAEDATERVMSRKIVPDHALFILPEWSLAGKRFTLEQKRASAAEAISVKEVDMLWNRALRMAKTGLSALPEVGPDWLPQTITPAGFWVDGHFVNDPLGLYGQNLSLSAYGTICKPVMIAGLENLAQKLEIEIYQVAASSQALATIVPARDALVLDIGADGTGVYLIRYDSLADRDYIPLGGRYFTRSMADAFRCDFDSAEALKLAYASQVLSQDDVKLVQRSLNDPLAAWGRAVVDVLIRMTGKENLPPHLFWTGGSVLLPGLSDILFKLVKETGLSFERIPEITYLGEQPLPGFTNEPHGFRGLLFASTLSLAKTI